MDGGEGVMLRAQYRRSFTNEELRALDQHLGGGLALDRPDAEVKTSVRTWIGMLIESALEDILDDHQEDEEG